MKKALIAAAVLALVASLAGCATFESPFVSGGTSPAAEQANLKFLISDEKNAIEDFEHVYVQISKIGMHLVTDFGNESGEWIEPAVANATVDLKPLIGENAQVLWTGNVPTGAYNKVFIYVEDAWGILLDGNTTVDLKVPGNKLHMTKPFSVSEGTTTNFVYDLSVVATGNAKSKNGVKYMLKPQIAQSGDNVKFKEHGKPGDEGQGSEGNQTGPGEGNQTGPGEGNQTGPGEGNQTVFELQFQGNTTGPSANVTLLVTDNGVPVAGATVYVNEQEMGNTDGDGVLVIVLPESGEVHIRAVLGNSYGELNFEFEEGGGGGNQTGGEGGNQTGV